MNGDLIFLVFFFIIIVGLFVIRIYYQLKSPDLKKPMRELTKKSVEHESRLSLAIGILAGISFVAAFVLYLYYPFLFPWLQLPFPDWLRWIGVILGFISLVAFWWVHSTLGREFSKMLTIQDSHSLITNGPYHRIRHPMYTSLLVYFFTWILISANLLFFIVWILMSLFLVARIPQEEAMLIDQFGDEYKEYQTQTGRLFPLLRKKSSSDNTS
jgi:protein-S-isoprenylcysteine O-methyltransferase Ste14